jgi:N-acetylglutamate synthase-like GNAT family acetyltransferase
MCAYAEQVIGTVALKGSELPAFDHSPWLAGLFVVPQHRGKGVGALLVGSAEREAASLGIERLYLYTPVSEHFYERLGWSVTHRYHLPSGPVAIMSKRVGGP